MTRISFIPNINLRELPRTIPQTLKNIDIKVGACFALALGVVLFWVVSKMMQPSKPAIFQASADKLGFPLEDLEKKQFLHILNGEQQSWTFKDVCQATIDAIRSESYKDKKNHITINGGRILDLLNFGLGEQSYVNAADKGNSWVHLSLQKLKDKKYIADFKIVLNEATSKLEIQIELNPQKINQANKGLSPSSVTKATEEVLPKTDSPTAVANPADDQKTNPAENAAPVSPVSMSRPDLKNATTSNLGFEDEILNQVWEKPILAGNQQWTFSKICDATIRAIQKESVDQKMPKLIINSRDSGHIIDYINFGLIEGTSYQHSSEKSKSWIDMILTKLSDKNYISGFEIGQSASGLPEISITLPR